MTLRWLLAFIIASPLVAGCRLLAELAESDPAAGAGPDASMSTDPRCEAWPRAPRAFDPCDLPPPQAALELGAGDWTFDTNSGSLTDPASNASFPTSGLVTTKDGLEVRAISVEKFTLAAGATLSLRGKRPLVVVSWTDAEVRGVIDATSRPGAPAAGANPDACNTMRAGKGADHLEGGAGGGGGGFGTAGAAGGSGADLMAAAGSAGAAAPSPTLRGGCAGGDGGNSAHGAGGDGGGAVVVAALDRVELSGTITAGGERGGAAQGGRSGGGGGGSGGYVELSAASVTLGASAIIAANGGGGGGGSDGSPATAGQDGQPGSGVASGGPGQGMGSPGGAGGAGAVAPKPGVSSHRGGGGGGGAVGVIRFDGSARVVDAAAILSPAPLP